MHMDGKTLIPFLSARTRTILKKPRPFAPPCLSSSLLSLTILNSSPMLFFKINKTKKNSTVNAGQKYFSTRNLVFLSLAAWLMAALSSCEKVIDLDLKNVEKKYVIEAN